MPSIKDLGPDQDFTAQGIRDKAQQEWWDTIGRANRLRRAARLGLPAGADDVAPPPTTRGANLAPQNTQDWLYRQRLKEAAELVQQYQSGRQRVDEMNPVIQDLVKQAAQVGVTLDAGDIANLTTISTLDSAANIAGAAIRRGDRAAAENVLITLRQSSPQMAAMLPGWIEAKGWLEENIDNPNFVEEQISNWITGAGSPLRMGLEALGFYSEQVQRAWAAASYVDPNDPMQSEASRWMSLAGPSQMVVSMVGNWNAVAPGAMDQTRLEEIRTQYPEWAVTTAEEIIRAQVDGTVDDYFVSLLNNPDTSEDKIAFIHDVLGILGDDRVLFENGTSADLMEQVSGARIDNAGDIITTGLLSSMGLDDGYGSDARAFLSSAVNFTALVAGDPLNYVGIPYRAVMSVRYGIAKLAPGLARADLATAFASRKVMGVETNRFRRYFESLLNRMDWIDDNAERWGAARTAKAMQDMIDHHKLIPVQMIRDIMDPKFVPKVNGKRTIDGMWVQEVDKAGKVTGTQKYADGVVDYYLRMNDEYTSRMGLVSEAAKKAGEEYMIREAVKMGALHHVTQADALLIAKANATDEIRSVVQKIEAAVRREGYEPTPAMQMGQMLHRDQLLPYRTSLGYMRVAAINSIIARHMNTTRAQMIVDALLTAKGLDVTPENLANALAENMDTVAKASTNVVRTPKDAPWVSMGGPRVRVAQAGQRARGMFASMPNQLTIRTDTANGARQVYLFARQFYDRPMASLIADQFAAGTPSTRRLLLAGLIRSGAMTRGLHLTQREVDEIVGGMATGSRPGEMFAMPTPEPPSQAMIRDTITAIDRMSTQMQKDVDRLASITHELQRATRLRESAVASGDMRTIRATTAAERRLMRKQEKFIKNIERYDKLLTSYGNRVARALNMNADMRVAFDQTTLPPQVKAAHERAMRDAAAPPVRVPPVFGSGRSAAYPVLPPGGGAPEIPKVVDAAADNVLTIGRVADREVVATIDDLDVPDVGKPFGVKQDPLLGPSGPMTIERAVDNRGREVYIATTPYDLDGQEVVERLVWYSDTGEMASAGGRGVGQAIQSAMKARVAAWGEESGVLTPSKWVIGPQSKAKVPAAPAPTAPDLPKLPKELSGAAPKWGQQAITFANDVDRALFIVRNEVVQSSRDADYMAFLRSALPGMDDDEIRQLGNVVAREIKGLSKASDDVIEVPAVVGRRVVEEEPPAAAAVRESLGWREPYVYDDIINSQLNLNMQRNVGPTWDPTDQYSAELRLGDEDFIVISWFPDGTLRNGPDAFISATGRKPSDEAADYLSQRITAEAVAKGYPEPDFTDVYLGAGPGVTAFPTVAPRHGISVAVITDDEVEWSIEQTAKDQWVVRAWDTKAGADEALDIEETFATYNEAVAFAEDGMDEARAAAGAAPDQQTTILDDGSIGTESISQPPSTIGRLESPGTPSAQQIALDAEGMTPPPPALAGGAKNVELSFGDEVIPNGAEIAPGVWLVVDDVSGEPQIQHLASVSPEAADEAAAEFFQRARDKAGSGYPKRSMDDDFADYHTVVPETPMPETWERWGEPVTGVKTKVNGWTIHLYRKESGGYEAHAWRKGKKPEGHGDLSLYWRKDGTASGGGETLVDVSQAVHAEGKSALHSAIDDIARTYGIDIDRGWGDYRPNYIRWRAWEAQKPDDTSEAAWFVHTDLDGRLTADSEARIEEFAAEYPHFIEDVGLGEKGTGLPLERRTFLGGIVQPRLAARGDVDPELFEAFAEAYATMFKPGYVPEGQLPPALTPAQEGAQAIPSFDEYAAGDALWGDAMRMLDSDPDAIRELDEEVRDWIIETWNGVGTRWTVEALDDPEVSDAFLRHFGYRLDEIPAERRTQYEAAYREYGDGRMQALGTYTDSPFEADTPPLRNPDGTPKYRDRDQEMWDKHGAISVARFMDLWESHGGEEAFWSWWNTGDFDAIVAMGSDEFLSTFGPSVPLRPDPGKGLPAARTRAQIPGEYLAAAISDPWAKSARQVVEQEIARAQRALARAKAIQDNEFLQAMEIDKASRRLAAAERKLGNLKPSAKGREQLWLQVPWKQRTGAPDDFVRKMYDDDADQFLAHVQAGGDGWVYFRQYMEMLTDERTAAARAQALLDEQALITPPTVTPVPKGEKPLPMEPLTDTDSYVPGFLQRGASMNDFGTVEEIDGVVYTIAVTPQGLVIHSWKRRAKDEWNTDFIKGERRSPMPDAAIRWDYKTEDWIVGGARTRADKKATKAQIEDLLAYAARAEEQYDLSPWMVDSPSKIPPHPPATNRTGRISNGVDAEGNPSYWPTAEEMDAQDAAAAEGSAPVVDDVVDEVPASQATIEGEVLASTETPIPSAGGGAAAPPPAGGPPGPPPGGGSPGPMFPDPGDIPGNEIPSTQLMRARLAAGYEAGLTPRRVDGTMVYSPSVDSLGRENAIHLFQAPSYVVIPHISDIERLAAWRTKPGAGIMARYAFQGATDWWSLLTLYGLRFAQRSMIEDLLAYMVTGGFGRLGDLYRGRRVSSAGRDIRPRFTVRYEKDEFGKEYGEPKLIVKSSRGMIAKRSQWLSDWVHRGNFESFQSFWGGRMDPDRVLKATLDAYNGDYRAMQGLFAEALARGHFTGLDADDVRAAIALGASHWGSKMIRDIAEGGGQINSGTVRKIVDMQTRLGDLPDIEWARPGVPSTFGDFGKLALAANPYPDTHAMWWWHRHLQAIVRDDGPIGQIFVKLMHDPVAAKKAIADAIRKDKRIGYKERFSLISTDTSIDDFASRYYEASLPYFQRADGTINEGLRSTFIETTEKVRPDGTVREVMHVNWYTRDKHGRQFLRLSHEDLKRYNRADRPMYVLGRKEGIPIPTSEKALWADRVWDWMGEQYARISREPIFIGNYLANSRALRGQRDGLAKAFAEARGGPGAKPIQQDLDLADDIVARQAGDAAYSFTLHYMDNPNNRSTLAWKVRNWARYYRATEDFARRATRIAQNYPDAYYKLVITYQALEDVGWTFRNDDGDLYFAYPMNEYLQDAFSTITGWFSGAVPSFISTDMNPFLIGGKVKGIAPSTDPEQWLPTISSPVGSVALTTLFNVFPSIRGARNLTMGGYSNAGGGEGLLVDIFNAVTPASVKRIWDALSPGEQDTAAASSAAATIAWMIADNRFDHVLNPDPNAPVTLEDIKQSDPYAEAQKRAVGLLITKLFLGFTAPAAPQVYQNNISDWGREAGFTSLDSLFHRLIDENDGDIAAAYIAWERLDPDGKLLPFTVASTKPNDTEGNLSGLTAAKPYKEVIEWRRLPENEELAERFPDVYMYLAPQRGEFDWSAWGVIKALGFRVNKTENELIIDMLAGQGERNDRAIKAYYAELIAQQDPTTKAGRDAINDIEAQRSFDIDANENSNPYWAEKKKSVVADYSINRLSLTYTKVSEMIAWMRERNGGEPLEGTAGLIEMANDVWVQSNIALDGYNGRTDSGKAAKDQIKAEMAATLKEIADLDPAAANYIDTVLTSPALWGQINGKGTP